ASQEWRPRTAATDQRPQDDVGELVAIVLTVRGSADEHLTIDGVRPATYGVQTDGEEVQTHRAERVDHVVGEIVVDGRRRDSEGARERIGEGGALLRTAAREAMNGRIHERHMLDRVMGRGARQAR